MASSSAQLRRLGAELRRLRLATGRTQGDVGEAIGRTHTTLVNWERGKTKISKSDLVCLLAELRVSVSTRKRLERLRDESGHGSNQWIVYGLPDWLRPLMSFEEDAVSIDVFDPILIPGPLQTEAYATATHRASPYLVAPTDVDRWVSARMLRQQRLAGENPLRLHAVITEAALRLAVGDPGVMAAQVESLIQAAMSDSITIQVLPFAAGVYSAQTSNFELLHFAEPQIDPPLGYFDGPLGGYMISDEGDVTTVMGMFADVCRAALNEADSLAMLTAMLDEWKDDTDV